MLVQLGNLVSSVTVQQGLGWGESNTCKNVSK